MKLQELFEESGSINLSVVPGQPGFDHFPNNLPKIVEGDFVCNDHPNLKDLKGCPEEIRGSFTMVRNTKMQNLKYGPKIVKGRYGVSHNKLTSLEGCPEEVGYINAKWGLDAFDCSYNSELTSLKGAPKIVNGEVHAQGCLLKNLDGIGKDYLCEINGKNSKLNLQNNAVLAHNMLGILKIKGLKKVVIDNKDVQEILNKYLAQSEDPKQRDLIGCAEELINAGYKDYAKF